MVAAWTAGTPAEHRRAAERETHHTRHAGDTDSTDRLAAEDVVADVKQLGDMTAELRAAEPEHKLNVYRDPGSRLIRLM